jgi:hypothetical protein
MFWTPALAAPQAFPTTTSNQIFIPGSPTPPTLEELKAMENAPVGEPLEPTGQLWIYMPNPRLYQLTSGAWRLAGIESWYTYQGVQGTLLVKQPNTSIHEKDFIGGWVGIVSSDNTVFLQTGWIYLAPGNPLGYPEGVYPFTQVGNYNRPSIYSEYRFYAGNYYTFRARYEYPSHWVLELYWGGQWRYLTSYLTSSTNLYPMAYGEVYDDAGGYHYGMFPLSYSLSMQIWEGEGIPWKLWSTWCNTRADTYMNLSIQSYWYNISYWGD